MCYVTCKKATTKRKFGWKVFRVGINEAEGKLFSTRCAPWRERDDERPVNRWLTAVPISKKVIDWKSPIDWYETGWSVFALKADAEATAELLAKHGTAHEVRRVEISGIRYDGPVRWSNQRLTRVLTCRKMRILPRKGEKT